MAAAESDGRANQKARTRRAILDACLELVQRDEPVTMLDVAKAALVSEATAYRYFPDLASLLSSALAQGWPDPVQALEPVATSTDPVERIAFATRLLLEGVAQRQGVVRAMISATISRPDLARQIRPGIRFKLIDAALAPCLNGHETTNRTPLRQLRRDLAVVLSPESLFCLTDLCGLNVQDAIDSAVHTAVTLTRAGFPPARGLSR